MIARRQLLQRLQTVAPALADIDTVPGLRHLWFTGTEVMAYNERIGLATPRTTTFTGGIPSATLIDLLAGSRAPAVDLIAGADGTVQLTLGSTSARLPMLPAERAQSLFTVPVMPKGNLLNGSGGRFFAAIEHCLQSVAKWSSNVESLGVTVIPNGNGLQLFATDKMTVTHVELPMTGLKRRVTLSMEFCEQMLRLAKQAHRLRLAVQRDRALFAADDTLLFGQLIPVEQPRDYAGMLRQHLTAPRLRAMVAVPAALRPALERAAKIAGPGPNTHSLIRIKDGSARLQTRGDGNSELTDTVALPGHPDIVVQVVAAGLCGGAAAAHDKILFTDNCVLTSRGGMLRLVATESGEEVEET